MAQFQKGKVYHGDYASTKKSGDCSDHLTMIVHLLLAS